MRSLVTCEHTGVGRAVVGDGRGSILGYDVDVEIHEALSADAWVGASHPVGGVARRTGEAGVDVALMLGEAGIRHDAAQAVALAAERVRTIDAEIGIAKEIIHQLPGRDGLAEFVAALEDVRPLGAVGAVRARASEFAIVVAVVTVGAEDLRADGAAGRQAIEL